jgi:hypothetical protein
VSTIFSSAVIFVKLFYLYLAFWFIEGPIKLTRALFQLLSAFEHFLSLTLMVKTFFRPWKNERRKRYVAYAIGIAATLRFFLIILDLIFLALVLAIGMVLIILFLVVPLIAVFLLFSSLLGYAIVF